MGISIDAERAFRWISSRWEKRSTITFTLVIVFILGALKFTNSDLSDFSMAEILFVTGLCLLIFLFWLWTQNIEKAPKNTIGIGIALKCESRDLEKKVNADLIEAFSEKLSNASLEHQLSPIIFPKHITRKIKDIESAGRIRVRARCHFLIWGTVRDRNIDGENKHVFKINYQVVHSRTTGHVSSCLQSEMTEFFPTKLLLSIENDFQKFEFTSDWVDCVVRYILGLASMISGDFTFSESLFNSLLRDSFLKNTRIVRFKKIRKRVKERLSDIYLCQAERCYRDWRETKEEIFLCRLWDNLRKTQPYPQIVYKIHLLKSIYFFVRNRDVDSAMTEIRKCKDIRDATWRYSYAFLLAYQGNMTRARRVYMNAFQLSIDPRTAIETEEFLLWILENEPEKIQLYFCLGLLNWKVKEDDESAIKYFNTFLEERAGQMNEFGRLATAHIATIDGERKTINS